jgi:hypothetical protein
MRKKLILFGSINIVIITFLFMGCTGLQSKPTEGNFKIPQVTLSHIELEHYFGYWYYSPKIKPTKGKNSGKTGGSPLDFAFIFEISNPNQFPVQMDGFSFSIALEEFPLNRAIYPETMWIPAGKTNQIRVHAMFDVNPALTSLLITGGFKLKEKGLSGWEQIEKWWTGAPDFSFPIHVTEGSAIFNADGIVKVAPFQATFP